MKFGKVLTYKDIEEAEKLIGKKVLASDFQKIVDKGEFEELITERAVVGEEIKTTLEQAITPKMTYNDNSGAEQETPLNFRGGIKAIFTINLDEELGI